jgi:hydrogenase maturation protease
MNVAADPRLERSLLVIGYGNELRSDDGVGAKVAAAVADWDLPRVRTLVRHQLAPELAEPISNAGSVVFVDASADASSQVELRQIKPAGSAQIMAHAADPRLLLNLAKKLFGYCPPAYWLTIPIESIAFGEGLSPRAQKGMEIALEKIRLLAEGSEQPAATLRVP